VSNAPEHLREVQTMKWDDTKQARLDALRAAELAGTLDEAGRAELAELIEAVEVEERERLASAFDRMRAEQAAPRYASRCRKSRWRMSNWLSWPHNRSDCWPMLANSCTTCNNAIKLSEKRTSASRAKRCQLVSRAGAMVSKTPRARRLHHRPLWCCRR
jgi:hypothetical protein